MSAGREDRRSFVASSSSSPSSLTSAVSMSAAVAPKVSRPGDEFGVPDLYPVTIMPTQPQQQQQPRCWHACEHEAPDCCGDRHCDPYDSYLQLRLPSSTDAAVAAAATCQGLVLRSRPPSPSSFDHHHHHHHSSSTAICPSAASNSSSSVISRLRGWPGGGRPWRLVAASKTLCAVSVTMAFVLGILIGVLVPLYASKALSTQFDDDAATAAASSLVVRLRQPSDGKVSFLLAAPEPLRPPSPEAGGKFAGPSPDSDSSNSVSSSPEKPASVPEWRRLVEGVYWTPEVEASLPRGFTDADVAAWRALTNHTPIVRMEEGCGRMQNRLVVFERGARSCARYRQNMDQIQGEIFSFYLSRILGFGNVPPASLDLVEATGPQWDRVRPELTLAQWMEQRPVVMTQWVDGLEPAHIPAPFRPSSRHLHPPDVNLQAQTLLSEDSQRDLKDLAQWSDLVVFDYLTANLDRVVNNLYNMQWNDGMMDAPAHNLARQTATGLLVFLDNESGLLHGFRLLDKYEPYHRKLLDSLCVFRRGTVEALDRLAREDDVSAVMAAVVARSHPDLADVFPALPEKYARILAERIRTVLKHVRRCERIYESS